MNQSRARPGIEQGEQAEYQEMIIFHALVRRMGLRIYRLHDRMRRNGCAHSQFHDHLGLEAARKNGDIGGLNPFLEAAMPSSSLSNGGREFQ